MTYSPKVYRRLGGDEMVVASGGVLKVESGGNVEVSGVAIPATVQIVAAAGGANVSEITFTVKDNAGNTLTGCHNLEIWLSDTATGAGLTATSASGTVQAKAASGVDLQTISAKKMLRVQTLATGIYTLSITDAAKTPFYPCCANPMTGKAIVGARLSAASYGA
jgi:hypothetical protein